MKLLTFTWSVSIEVPDTFNSEVAEDYYSARHEAWMNVQRSDGELTDEQDIPADEKK